MWEYKRNAKVGFSIGSGVKNSVLSYCSTPMLYHDLYSIYFSVR